MWYYILFSLSIPALFDSADVALAHDIHMSRCDIDYNKEASSLEISIRIFLDDLELDLRSQGHDSLKICTQYEREDAEELVFDYIKQHLVIEVDDQTRSLEWVGKEISDDLSAVWCYLQVHDVQPQKHLDITNEVLLSTYDDQQNVVKVIVEGERSFFLFDRKEYSGRVEIN